MLNSRVCSILFAMAAIAALQTDALAAVPTITLTMDDLPGRPIDGLVHPQGVQFGFTVNGASNADARYAAGGPGNLTFVQDPSIEGTTLGVVSLIFSVPTPILEFGVARNVEAAVPNGVAVELFNAANLSLGETLLALDPQPRFAEGKFVYSGEPVKRATLDFTSTSSGIGGIRFALDNLAFTTVPEPLTPLMTCVALVAATHARRHIQRRSRPDSTT